MTHHLPDPERQPHFYEGVPVRRLLAWLIDTVIIVALSLVVVLLSGGIAMFFWPLVLLAISFAYRVITLANASATPGMRFCGIELRAGDGTRFGMSLAFAHTAGYTISLAIPVIQGLSVILMAIGPRNQGLSDMVLGTVALNRKV